MIEDILQISGLSVDILKQLSYKSQLHTSLKKNLHYFDRDKLIDELSDMVEWISMQAILEDIDLDFRIKSIDSIRLKYERYYPDSQTRKVFNDVLGFRAFCDDYNDLLKVDSELFKVVDLSNGKASDDGYRGVHLYYQLDNHHYPIEIQYNTYYDRQINNWLHSFLYKKNYSDSIGQEMRRRYEMGKIKSENDFKEELEDVLCHS